MGNAKKQFRYQRAYAGFFLLLLLGQLLPLTLLAPAASGARTIDYALRAGLPVHTLDIDVTAGTPPGLTVDLPLNASAQILDTHIEMRAAPEFRSTLLRGWGTPDRNREDFGKAIEGRGDYNRDGLNDVAIGSEMGLVPNEPGRVDVYYGAPGGLPALPDWSYVGPSGIQFGGTMSHGDINHDGVDDLVVGEQNLGYQGEPPEEAFVFFGSPGGLSPSPDLVMASQTPSVETGWANSVLAADLNGDGLDELIIPELIINGSPYASRMWIYWGEAGGPSASNLTYIEAPGPDFFEFGWPAFELGDSDGDGLEEIYSGKINYHGSGSGIVVFEGVANSTAVNLVWDFNGSGIARLRDGFTGGADLTGDGFADFIGSTSFDNLSIGRTFVFEGLANGSYGMAPSFFLDGEAQGDTFGISACTGDFDADGQADLVVGADRSDSTAEGGAYFFHGPVGASSRGVYFEGGAPGLAEGFGSTAATLGDVDGDGITDFAIALAYGHNGTYQPGAVRVYYGDRHPLPENATVFAGGQLVWSTPGQFSSNASIRNATAPIQAYLDAHAADRDASGGVAVPLRFEFGGGGRLEVSRIYVRFTVLLAPEGVAAVSDASGDAVAIRWAVRSPPTDGSMIAVWSNKSGPWASIANVSASRGSYVDVDVVTGQPESYRLTEWDPFLRRHSDPSPVVSVTPLDTKPPLVPAVVGLDIDIPNRAATLRWVRNADDTVGYEVFRQAGDTGAFELLAALGATASAFRDAGLDEEVNFSYKVRAVDEAGLASPFSEPLVGRVPDLLAPATPRGLIGDSLPSGSAVRLSWTANTADTVAYVILASGPGSVGPFEEAGVTAGSEFVISGLQRGATYSFKVAAVDQAGHRSLNASVSVTTSDLMAPQAPLITSVAALPQGKAAAIEWTAFDDDIFGFHISWRTSGSWQEAAYVDGTLRAYTLTGLTDGVPVQIRIAAEDANGQRGADSAPVTVVPRDGAAPGVPTGVTVTALPEGGALRVEWTAPGDLDVTGYKVYYKPSNQNVSLALAGVVGQGATGFTHRGLQDSVAYSYQVAAIDDAVNEGPKSAPVQGLPQDVAPPGPPTFEALPARTNQAALRVTGTADPGTQVEFEVNGFPAGSATVTTRGTFTHDLALREGDNTVRARAFDPRPGASAAAKYSGHVEPPVVVLDTVAPTVVRADPQDGASAIALLPAMKLHASEALEPDSLHAVLRSAGGAETAVHLVYDAATMTVSVSPDVELAPGSTYTLEVDGTDVAGNPLVPFHTGFSTAAAASNTGPYLISVAALGAAAVGGVLLRRRSSARRRSL